MLRPFFSSRTSRLEVLLFCMAYFTSTGVWAKYVPFLEPGFFFDYNKPGVPVPIPITEQCETIHMTWGRSSARGPNPVAPYFMQVYASTSTQPFVIPVGSGLTFDWTVPFAPGTLYQICMFDHNGVTGGCQSMYTMVKNSTTSTPVCQNVTVAPLLDIEGTVPGGPMSQYGFIDQCTDVTITPKSGKPPFILTVAPALHPPYNITSKSMDPITWTVSLSWAFPFFLSMVSADGKTWANGPMHSGGFGPSDCLAPGSITRASAQKITAGAGIGSLIVGSVVGVAVSLVCFNRRQKARRMSKLESKLESLEPSPRSYEADRPLPPVPSSVPFVTRVKKLRSISMARTSVPSTDSTPSVFPYTVVRPVLMTQDEAKAALRSVPRPAIQVVADKKLTANLPDTEFSTFTSYSSVPGPVNQHRLTWQSGFETPQSRTLQVGVDLPPRYSDQGHGRPEIRRSVG